MQLPAVSIFTIVQIKDYGYKSWNEPRHKEQYLFPQRKRDVDILIEYILFRLSVANELIYFLNRYLAFVYLGLNRQ
jgi:hypothetical protein